MLRREALPTYGRKLADALSSPNGEALVTLWPSRGAPDERGEELEVGWPEFYEVLSTRRPFRGPFEHPGFSAASFAPLIRTPSNIRSVSALVLTFGVHDGVSLESFSTSWSDVAGLVYTAPQHSTTRHAFTAVLPFVRVVSAEEYKTIFRSLVSVAQQLRRPIDLAAANAARFVHLPGAVPGRPFSVHLLEGLPLGEHGGRGLIEDRRPRTTSRTT